eukprot:3603521-Rhodomonas_salina.1
MRMEGRETGDECLRGAGDLRVSFEKAGADLAAHELGVAELHAVNLALHPLRHLRPQPHPQHL